jgi:hypothetical protein
MPLQIRGRGIGKVVAEGAVHLDVEQARKDAGGLAPEASGHGLVRRLDGHDDAVVDGHEAEPTILGGEQVAKDLDHRIHVTFA